jgi:hypothetical protein
MKTIDSTLTTNPIYRLGEICKWSVGDTEVHRYVDIRHHAHGKPIHHVVELPERDAKKLVAAMNDVSKDTVSFAIGDTVEFVPLFKSFNTKITLDSDESELKVLIVSVEGDYNVLHGETLAKLPYAMYEDDIDRLNREVNEAQKVLK